MRETEVQCHCVLKILRFLVWQPQVVFSTQTDGQLVKFIVNEARRIS